MGDTDTEVVFTQQADTQLAQGQLDDALRSYTALLDSNPADPYLWLRCAALLGRLGSNDDAARHLGRVVDRLAQGGELLLALTGCKELERLAAEPAAAALAAVAELYGRGSERLERRRRSVPPPLQQQVGAPLGEAGEAQDLTVLRELALDACERALARCDADAAAPQDERKLPFQPLLSELAPNDLVSLVPLMTLSHRAPGEVVIEQGAEGDSIYLLVRGSLAVSQIAAGGEETSLATLRPGALLGEMALITDSPRAAQVVCGSAVTLFEIQRDALERLASSTPAVAEVLGNYTRERLLRSLMATSPLFRPLDQARRASLVSLFESVVVAPQELVVEEGSASQSLYVVLSGAVVVTKQEGGETLTLARLQPGQIFGEISLIKDRDASATVRAERQSVLLKLSRTAFNQHVKQFPEVLAHVYNVALEREETNLQLQGAEPVDVEDDLMI